MGVFKASLIDVLRVSQGANDQKPEFGVLPVFKSARISYPHSSPHSLRDTTTQLYCQESDYEQSVNERVVRTLSRNRVVKRTDVGNERRIATIHLFQTHEFFNELIFKGEKKEKKLLLQEMKPFSEFEFGFKT